MKKHVLLLAAISLLSFTSTYSQKGIYVKFSGIVNTNTGIHANEFPVLAFEMSDSSTSTSHGGSGSGSGKAYFGNAKLKKVLDPETNPELMSTLASGKHLSTVTITWYNSSNVAYYQIILSDNIFQKTSILSPQCAGSDCDNLFEELHIDYGTIKWLNPVTGTFKTATP